LLRTNGPRSTSITRLYTRNLAGAICGSIVAGFFLLPTFGVRATIYIAALINILIGIVSIVADRRMEIRSRLAEDAAPVSAEDLKPEEAHLTADAADTRFWMACALISGFVTISTQVAWTRLLTMIVGSSTYAFSIVVALFL